MYYTWKHRCLAHGHAAWRRSDAYARASADGAALGYDIGHADAAYFGARTAYPHARRPSAANGHCRSAGVL